MKWFCIIYCFFTDLFDSPFTSVDTGVESFHDIDS
jgi:hypothetical protein